ncbi:MAG: hypothetical protein KJO76_02925, partial [Gammaproteobacteria bacterium]|nr:hypothetical protein [Gammaproteobacteria bacterium]
MTDYTMVTDKAGQKPTGRLWLAAILLSLALSFTDLTFAQADLLPDESDGKPLSELTEADLLPDEDPVLTGVLVWGPRAVIETALEREACEMRGDPCDPIALHAIRTMVLPKLRFNDQIPVTETLEFPYEDNGRHKTYENQWGEERLAPG